MGYLSDDEIGELTERMLIEATSRYRPSWVRKVERASTYLNYRGIDTIVYVKYPDGRVGPLLIQVKSKEEWRKKYFEVDHPWAIGHKVLCLVINPWDTDVKICLDSYRELNKMRKANIWQMDTLAWRLREGTAPLNQEKMRWIEAAYALNPQRPRSKQGAGFWRTLYLRLICLFS